MLKTKVIILVINVVVTFLFIYFIKKICDYIDNFKDRKGC